ncbi:Uncharacterised protein [Mycobacteroides abscessus subsp. abscessus]|uniref:hypothetical protein n=1 Tax=Mycobacteroides abscessus TaxID=36809 RepID=UPI00092C7256|nr:hypothetical protein [Mycobacteroides abscessus]SIM04608.1 Uncharacterised protein [Mycobacteroides abscessus subsp. abscessus]SLC77836.1 Uncharacterised protein [Mycobacteroides abscessus subsp. abscessus]
MTDVRPSLLLIDSEVVQDPDDEEQFTVTGRSLDGTYSIAVELHYYETRGVRDRWAVRLTLDGLRKHGAECVDRERFPTRQQSAVAAAVYRLLAEGFPVADGWHKTCAN